MLQGVRRTFGRDITNNVAAQNGKESGAPLAKKPTTTSTSFFSAPLASLGIAPAAAAAPAPVASRQQGENEASEGAHYDDEMEMDSRAHMQRPADDIDSRDMGNPLLCTIYVNEMYNLFFDQERQLAAANPSNYMPNQPHINEKMRCILIDWMIEVHLKFKMVPETLYLTVNLIDRYLQLKTVRRSKLQLVGVACLMLASKYEEIYPPELRDLVYITDRAYTKQEIVEMENEVIKSLNWNMTVPTIHSFLCRFLKAAHADRTLVQLACYVTERSLQEYSMTKYLPSTIAAASVLIARKACKRNPWSTTLVKYTTYEEQQLTACVQEMVTAINDPACQQQAVFRKYSSPKFGTVSKIPLTF